MQEVEQCRSNCRDRQLQLILKLLLHPLVGNQLILRQIDRLSLDAVAVLHRLSDVRRKRCGITLAVLILQNLGPILGDDPANIDIEHLPAFIADGLISARRQGAPIDIEDFDFVGIGNLFQRGANMPGLAAGLVGGACRRFIARGEAILGRRLTAVTAVQAQAIDQQLHDQD